MHKQAQTLNHDEVNTALLDFLDRSPVAFFAVKIDRPADHLPLGFCKEAGRIEQGSCQHGSVWTVFSGNAGLIAPEIVQKTREIGEIFIKTSFFCDEDGHAGGPEEVG